MQKQSGSKPLVLGSALLALTTLLATGAPGSAAEGSAAERPEGSVAVGKALFRVYCASCHGTEARGDGALAEHLRVPPADLTRLAADNEGVFPRDAVFRSIDGRETVRGHGDSDMPVWGDVFQREGEAEDAEAVERKIASLVAYLETLQEEEHGRSRVAATRASSERSAR